MRVVLTQVIAAVKPKAVGIHPVLSIHPRECIVKRRQWRRAYFKTRLVNGQGKAESKEPP